MVVVVNDIIVFVVCSSTNIQSHPQLLASSFIAIKKQMLAYTNDIDLSLSKLLPYCHWWCPPPSISLCFPIPSALTFCFSICSNNLLKPSKKSICIFAHACYSASLLALSLYPVALIIFLWLWCLLCHQAFCLQVGAMLIILNLACLPSFALLSASFLLKTLSLSFQFYTPSASFLLWFFSFFYSSFCFSSTYSYPHSSSFFFFLLFLFLSFFKPPPTFFSILFPILFFCCPFFL